MQQLPFQRPPRENSASIAHAGGRAPHARQPSPGQDGPPLPPNLSPLHALAQRRGARRPGPRAGCDSSCAYFRALQRRSSCDMDLPPQQVGPEPPPKRPCTAGAGVQGMQLALLQPAAPTSSVQFSTIAELLEHEDVYCEACAHQPPHPAPPPPPPCRTSRATAADSWGERSSTKLTVPARARRRTSQVRRRHP